MRLEELLRGIDYRVLSGNSQLDIQGIAFDSKQVKPGFLFVCISGMKTDGHLFIGDAVKNGASAVLVQNEETIDPEITCILTENTRKALAVAASNFYREPSRTIKVIGVTGTNGKTTTTHLIRAILEEAGHPTSIMGTLYAKIGESLLDMNHTTPEATVIEEFLDASRKSGCEYAVMEVSSHALDLFRVDRINFHAAVFTNLTQDHLDYHLDMEHYLASKVKLFDASGREKSFYTVVNGDDYHSTAFVDASLGTSHTYGIQGTTELKAVDVQTGVKGTSFTVLNGSESFMVNMKIIGMFNVYNALAAISVALKEGVDIPIIQAAMQKVTGVAGRFEQVNCGQPFTVIVDYAHTPDGLENILTTARELCTNRLITVFGCGGDRDRGKRPLMGEIAARLSDFCVVTSDNPRSEEPEAIIADIVPGLERVVNSRYAIIIDRCEAIRHALYLAREGDFVVIAGKGHETYQLVKGEILDFDDRKIAAGILTEIQM
ncbi:MAG: UDP-N-acetylmuramoyl-L-alanyl-D-glutamate--2,6-diaminopimelate ligase [Deltaproteobacteria bacterium]